MSKLKILLITTSIFISPPITLSDYSEIYTIEKTAIIPIQSSSAACSNRRKDWERVKDANGNFQPRDGELLHTDINPDGELIITGSTSQMSASMLSNEGTPSDQKSLLFQMNELCLDIDPSCRSTVIDYLDAIKPNEKGNKTLDRYCRAPSADGEWTPKAIITAEVEFVCLCSRLITEKPTAFDANSMDPAVNIPQAITDFIFEE